MDMHYAGVSPGAIVAATSEQWHPNLLGGETFEDFVAMDALWWRLLRHTGDALIIGMTGGFVDA